MKRRSLQEKLISFGIRYRYAVVVLVAAAFVAGLVFSPFESPIESLPRDPLSVDAIPDIGENQQIVVTRWEGRSPAEVEQYVTWPLSNLLTGVKSVKSVRGLSMFGDSFIYVIFEEDVPFYESRTRLLEKLATIGSGVIPAGLKPSLGPDATGLGQIFWYSLQARDEQGQPAPGWDAVELRTIQEYHVKPMLTSVSGVSEVSSIGGNLPEYAVDLDPDKLRIHGVTVEQVAAALASMNVDVTGRNIEINGVEYILQGRFQAASAAEIAAVPVRSEDGTSLPVSALGRVSFSARERRGILNIDGRDAVGGIIVAAYGADPLSTINGVKAKIREMRSFLPEKKLPDGRISRVTIVPFYDRTTLIQETIGTLKTALRDEILVTSIVILFLIINIRGSVIISLILPASVLITFIFMKILRVDANILSLGGIAIAIGTMVDTGIIVFDSVNRRLREHPDEGLEKSVITGTGQVAGAILTSVLTTMVAFLPVLFLSSSEGKLFRPLAITKTAAIFSAFLLSVYVVPVVIYMAYPQGGFPQLARALSFLRTRRASAAVALGFKVVAYGLALALVVWFGRIWMPLGLGVSGLHNVIFTAVLLLGMLGFYKAFHLNYERILRLALSFRLPFAVIALSILAMGFFAWRGYRSVLPVSGELTRRLDANFPGIQSEFMPQLDEGSFLFMPSLMPHASIGEVDRVLRAQGLAIAGIPEVETAAGKAGRADSALDPAPLSMIETIITLKTEYLESKGIIERYAVNADETDLFRDPSGKPVPDPEGKPYLVSGKYSRTADGSLIPDPDGRPFRIWRLPLDPDLNPGRAAWPGIRRSADIWEQITQKAGMPQVTSAPILQPISARTVMLQTGMRSRLGIKVYGSSPHAVENAALLLAEFLKKLDYIRAESVNVDRAEGKPQLTIEPKIDVLASYGVNPGRFLEEVAMAIGGMTATTVNLGKERIPVTVRFAREYRDNPEALRDLIVTVGSRNVPLREVAELVYVSGPAMIRSEGGFPVSYVTFENSRYSEGRILTLLEDDLARARQSGKLKLPDGSGLELAGTFIDQRRAEKRLMLIVPLSLLIILLILYFQFRDRLVVLIVLSGVVVAAAGGFILLWLFSQGWFMDFSVYGRNMRDVFQIHPVNLSVAVWVGFLALAGIATDDGVVMASRIVQLLKSHPPQSRDEIRELIVRAGNQRIRGCISTTATTVLALLPVLSSSGRGSDLMIPMAIPVFGGMIFEIFTMLVVPFLYTLLL
ncbi:efflux RND transporter permease subunit, partial [Myxococcota bacterium]|nr:efflux RND transporter permease subunit [Myxococcota bacterium]